MKKIVKFFLIGVVSLIVLSIIGLLIFIMTFDIKRFKPVIITAAQNAVGRQITFDDIALKVSLKQGILLHLAGLSIAEDPAFGSAPFLTADRIDLGVSLGELIMKRQIRVLNVAVKAPQVTVVRLKDGRVNIQSLSKPGEKSLAGQNTQSPKNPPPASVIPALFINNLILEGMKIRYIDRSSEPAIDLECRDIRLAVQDFSLTRPFRFTLSAAFASSSPDINFEGKGEVNMGKGSFVLKDSKLNLDLSVLSLDELRRSIPQVQNVPLSGISGTIASDIRQMEAGPQGVTLLIDAEMKDGRISVQNIGEGISLNLQRVNAAIKGFSLGGEFDFNIQAACLSQNQNLSIQGKAKFIPDKQSVELVNTEIGTDLASVSLEELKKSVPKLKDASLPEQLKGKIKINVEQLSAGPAGLVFLKARGALTEGGVTMKELAAPLESIQSKFNLTESAVAFSDTSCSIGKGTIALSGEIKDYLKTQDFQFKTKLERIDLSQCLDQSAYSIKAQGLVSGAIEGSGKGFDPNVILSTMNAAGNLEVKEGRLVDINVLKMVLDRLSFVPNLTALMEANLPEQYKEKLKQKDTVITALKLNAALANGSINIQPVALEAEGFIFEGTGTAGFDQSYSLNGSFAIPEDMASRMVESVPEIKFLQNEAQQIRFPLKVSGKGSTVSFMPDIQGMGVTAIKNKAAEELLKVFDKVFKPKEEQPK